jgi:hypothetical protein
MRSRNRLPGKVVASTAIIVIGVVALAAVWTIAVENTAYLTPIPETTLSAYREGGPVNSRLEAAIAARQFLGVPRLKFAEEPKLLIAEAMTRAEAQERIDQWGLDVDLDGQGQTRVWLVVFEGVWQVFPPDPGGTWTPPPPARGCNYVIFEAADGGMRTEMDRFTDVPNCAP